MTKLDGEEIDLLKFCQKYKIPLGFRFLRPRPENVQSPNVIASFELPGGVEYGVGVGELKIPVEKRDSRSPWVPGRRIDVPGGGSYELVTDLSKYPDIGSKWIMQFAGVKWTPGETLALCEMGLRRKAHYQVGGVDTDEDFPTYKQTNDTSEHVIRDGPIIMGPYCEFYIKITNGPNPVFISAIINGELS